MNEKIIRLSDLVAYHHVSEVYKDSIACFQMDDSLVNIDTVPPAFADIFSFIVITSGSATFTINYSTCTLGRGDMLLISPSMLVSVKFTTPDFSALDLICERSLFEHMLSSFTAYRSYSLFFCRPGLPVLKLTDSQTEEMSACMRQISSSTIRSCAYQEAVINHQLHAFLLQLLELVENSMATLPPAVSHAETLFHKFISELIANYREEHSIGFYARQLCISTTYLSRVIRQVTGKTAGYFIGGLLYAEACRMLVLTDKTVQAIAAELHFSDQSSFGKFFRNNSGVSPMRYRDGHRQQKPSGSNSACGIRTWDIRPLCPVQLRTTGSGQFHSWSRTPPRRH